MSINEASYIIKRVEDDFVNTWNQTRLISYSIVQSQSTKKIKLDDFLKFPWEKKEDDILLPKRSREDLLKHALEMEKIINKK